MHYKAAMPDNSIYILTGEINSGKTTAIANWATGRKDVFGVLTPKIYNNRVFENINTGEQFKMEAAENETAVFKIGRYTFCEKAFEKASLILQENLKRASGWLIVDEIGPLELQQKGFYQTITNIIANNNYDLKKLLVVRMSLLEEMISFFKIKTCTIVKLPLKID
jgi:nucleoside-triphosphatase THEP1